MCKSSKTWRSYVLCLMIFNIPREEGLKMGKMNDLNMFYELYSQGWHCT